MAGMNIEIKIPLSHPRVEYSITGGDGSTNPIIVSSMPTGSIAPTYTQKPLVTRQVYTSNNPQQTTVTSATMRTSSGRRVEVNVQPSAPTSPTLYQGYSITTPGMPTVITPQIAHPQYQQQPVFTTKVVSPPQLGILDPPPQAGPARQSSRVECDEHRFAVTLDVSEYNPEDIEVKVKDNKLSVHAEQKEGTTTSGYVQREYYRQYTLPDDVDIALVKCSLSEKGVLVVEVPRVSSNNPKERRIPIVVDRSKMVMGPPGVKHTYFVEEINTSDADSFKK